MELFFGIVLLVISFLLIFFIFICQKEDEYIIIAALSGALVMIFLTIGITLIQEYYSPRITFMDVYRGKTTLEITYRDSIAIDSTVVWKEEVK